MSHFTKCLHSADLVTGVVAAVTIAILVTAVGWMVFEAVGEINEALTTLGGALRNPGAY
jgi:hypothetical protein